MFDDRSSRGPTAANATPPNLRSRLARRLPRRAPLLLLPALALAALAVLLATHHDAPPASADHANDVTVWSGTLTVKGLAGSTAGCDTSLTSPANKCSTSTTLSEDDFTYNGTNYQISGLLNYLTSKELKLFLNSGSQVASPNVLRGLALVVDGKRYSLFSATIDGNNGATWSVSENWSAGDTVQLKLTTQFWTGVDLYGGGLETHSDGAVTLDVTKSSGNTFMVKLTQAPTAEVTITFSKLATAFGIDDFDAVTVSPETLTFTTSNWQTGQGATVSATTDAAVGDSIIITAKVSIASSADSDDPYRNPDRRNGFVVTVKAGGM